jgi:hypothetical protein
MIVCQWVFSSFRRHVGSSEAKVDRSLEPRQDVGMFVEGLFSPFA